MLSLAKLRVGSEAYHLSGVAQSLDDYYTGRGEADGFWVGAGAERLGLDGLVVVADDLRAVLAGLTPGAGGLTPNGEVLRASARRVPGFDATFKAPKSVSVLYAVSDDPRVRGAIIEAGEAALRETVAWLEREAIQVRRGSGDVRYLADLAARDPDSAEAARQRALPGRGVVAAAFRHRTSRAGDPLLHWHTLIANMVEGPDGKWGAFVHPELYRHARAGGEFFQTVLRGELTARLGVEWRSGRHVPEIAGVPQQLCDLLSKRSTEIDAWLQATGTPDDAAGRQAAVLATRRGKPELEGERFDAAWQAEATAAGWGPEQAELLIASGSGRATPGYDEVWRIPRLDERTGTVADEAVSPEEWINELGRALTETDSTFTRPQVVAEVARRIGEGATASTIDRVAARVLASAQVVPIDDAPSDAASTRDRPTSRWTTVELMDVELHFLHTAHAGRNTRAPLPAERVARVIAANGLDADQAAAVATLTGSTDAVSVLVGPAGTGKTYTLNSVREAFESAGYSVVGVALAAKGALELDGGAAIDSSTIHRLLGAWERGFDLPHSRTVLVVDEAGMAGIRDLDRVVGPVVAAGGRVILAGDHHQLPEVNAGGGFAALATDSTSTVAELAVNRRQHHRWEQEALRELRNGHLPTALAAYRDHGRIIAASDRQAMIDEAVDRWFAAHRAGRIPVLVAGTNELVDALNDAVRRRLIDEHILGDTIAATDGSLALGERLMVLRNDYRVPVATGHGQVPVLNGQTGTLVGTDQRGLTVQMDGGAHVVLADEFVRSGGVGYSYAGTAHKSQGGSWDVAIGVGLDGMYRELFYLMMSRGREENVLVATQTEIDTLDAELARHGIDAIPLPDEAPDPFDTQLLARVGTSRRKLLAVARDPHAPEIQHLATTLDYPALARWAAYAAGVEHHAARLIGGDPTGQQRRLARTEHTAGHAAIGQLVKAWDRANIGTITGLHDDTGQVHVTFVSAAGKIGERVLGWGDVTIVNPRQPDERALTATAAHALERATAPLRENLERRAAVLAAHGVQPDDAHIYRHAAMLAAQRHAHALAAEQPEWLVSLIGPRPDHHQAATQVWDDGVADLATHRLRQGLTDPATRLTADSPDPAAAAAWEAASPSLAGARVWLDTHTNRPTVPITRTRSLGELHTRQAELAPILASAPPDTRGLIQRTLAGGTLPLADTAQLLAAALATQGARLRWILEHWPHVIEAAEITRTLANHTAGPDIDELLTRLATSPTPELAAAARTREPWLITLAAHLDPTGTPMPGSDPEELLADVARYRTRWNVTGHNPLGDSARDLFQAAERDLLETTMRIAVEPDLADHARIEDELDLFDPVGP